MCIVLWHFFFSLIVMVRDLQLQEQPLAKISIPQLYTVRQSVLGRTSSLSNSGSISPQLIEYVSVEEKCTIYMMY